ncbi:MULTISPECIES: DUF3558 domain-containing protein [unclassified Nocardia]
MAVASFCAATAVLAGCDRAGSAKEPSQTETATTRPSLAVSVAPPPAQVSTGRTDVKHDPCSELPDAAVSSAGFDPSTRARADQIHDSYAFIGCTFAHKEQIRGQLLTTSNLTVSSTNITLDEFRAREGANARAIKINGRDAITYQKNNAEACYITMTGPDGTIDVGKSVNGAFTNEPPCQRIDEIAKTIEESLNGK